MIISSDKSDAVLAADQQTEPKPIQEVQTIQDNDIVQLPQPSVDADSTMISVSIPCNEQDVRATIMTTSILDNRNVDSSSDTGIFKILYYFEYDLGLKLQNVYEIGTILIWTNRWGLPCWSASEGDNYNDGRLQTRQATQN